jgi:hypothetical protein
MIYKIEPDGLSYVIYRKRGIFSRWEKIARTMPTFDEFSMKQISTKDFDELRLRSLRHLADIKEMDKILIRKFK